MKQESGGGDYTKTVRCPKCGRSVVVHGSNPDILKGLKDYKCAECRGVYDKFGGKVEKDEKIESDAA